MEDVPPYQKYDRRVHTNRDNFFLGSYTHRGVYYRLRKS